MENFYNIINEHHSESCLCELQINWNVPVITYKQKDSGYIVQVFSRKLTPQNILKTPEYEDISYAEAWCVCNGKIIEEDRGELCNDIFSIGNPLDEFSEFSRSVGTKGQFEFTGTVFWISYDNCLYDEISNWSRTTVKQAGGLKASYNFTQFVNLKQCFERTPFIHTWDLTDENIIYINAKQRLFRFCPNNTKRDKELLEENAAYLLGEKYQYLAKRIITEWHNQW